jgi:glycosyltransferase involved in cell wall biosynthesis
MTILVLCGEGNLCNMLARYAEAFRRRGIRLVCADPGFERNGTLDEWLRLCPERPSLIWHPESDVPFLPWGLTSVDIPTACFQVDTYAYTSKRIAWSMLFDLALVFHPGYEARFRDAGHPGARFVAHAVDGQHFAGPEMERIYDVGWVGQINGPIYGMRGPILNDLSKSFRMNDAKRRHSLEEMARAYRQSKIVVNVGRDDYPQDANLRTFEAMAGGALLITSLPTELSTIGLEEGIHFVGYRDVGEIAALVRRYVGDEPARRKIGEAARKKVLDEHTYDRRVDMFLELVAHFENERSAPARGWAESRVRLTYLDYFAGNGALDCASAELAKIARLSLPNAAAGAALLGRAWQRRARGRLKIHFGRN